MISHQEAQELHLLIGGPLEVARQNGAFDPEYITVKASDLERARELAALIVADTEPTSASSKYTFDPVVTGRIEIGGQASEFMLPLDDDSVMYSQWGADNTVLWPRVSLVEGMAEEARGWWADNRPANDNENED